jgi:CDP-glucose 4,6-dehydratase
VEGLVMFGNIFHGRTVWLSGHTGFKGSWLAEWLLNLGAKVHGYALSPNTTPALFDQLGLASRLQHELNDIGDLGLVKRSIEACQPDFVFHLAAQPLVRWSYAEPVNTYATNVMGTMHVLEALRSLRKPCTAVFVTTDKCYENREWVHGYREDDPLGGYDPYSSSKAAAEIVIGAYRRSFFHNHPVLVGGGDWAPDRIVPDCIRSLQRGVAIPVRNKVAVRPWQHVLEPLSGYLWLAAKLTKDASVATAFNFGPNHEANRTVAELVAEVLKHWPGRWEDKSDPNAVHEAELLQLSTDKAHALLGWTPVWDFPTAIERTVHWYRNASRELTVTQIAQYAAAARERGLPWS